MMPIFQFHIRDPYGLIIDDEGIELPDLTAVLREALNSSDEFLSEAFTPTDMLFEVTDEADRIVLVLPIRPGAAADRDIPPDAARPREASSAKDIP